MSKQGPRLQEARDALESRIESLEDDVETWEAERDELAMRVRNAEERIQQLQGALEKLYDLEDDEIEDVLAGELVSKSPRMVELEAISMRGRSWSEWLAVNDEYRREAESQRKGIADLLEDALA